MVYVICVAAGFAAGILFELLGMGTRIRTALANAIRPKATTISTAEPPKIKKVG